MDQLNPVGQLVGQTCHSSDRSVVQCTSDNINCNCTSHALNQIKQELALIRRPATTCLETSCKQPLHGETFPTADIAALKHIELHFKPAATFTFQLLAVTCTAAPTHPGGLHSFLPGGNSSRLFRGTIPMAACMMVMNFLNFIFQIHPRMYRKASHGEAQCVGRCYASADHLPKESRGRFKTETFAPLRPSWGCCKLAGGENGLSPSVDINRSVKGPRCSGYYEPPAHQRLSLTDVLLALLSEAEDKRKTRPRFCQAVGRPCGNDSTSRLRNSGSSLDITLMKTQPLPPPPPLLLPLLPLLLLQESPLG